MSKETQNTNWKEYRHPYVIYNSQDLQAAQVSINSRYKKLWYISTMEYYSPIGGKKKEGNLTLCDSMDGPGEHYAKLNEPVRERQVPYDLTYIWNQMNKLNKQTK